MFVQCIKHVFLSALSLLRYYFMNFEVRELTSEYILHNVTTQRENNVASNNSSRCWQKVKRPRHFTVGNCATKPSKINNTRRNGSLEAQRRVNNPAKEARERINERALSGGRD